uniref:Pyrin domain-containing protein n=1 Tax=Kryptolebias marmoratus TaxID=37003 RepID=A0A3Q3AB75_KRYMA
MASEQLLKTLENMSNDDFETFKWFLEKPVVEDCKPIPKCHLEDAKRTKIVTKMIESYGDNLAVKVAIEVLRKQRLNDVAEKLKKAYEGE